MIPKNQILDRMSNRQLVSINIQKTSGRPEDDDTLTISRSSANLSLFNITMKSFNGNIPYKGMLSTSDLFDYLDKLFWVIYSDEDSAESRISHIQYNIPGFPSVVMNIDTCKQDDEPYERFIDAMKFWAHTL
jgi:hypothetical protein